MSRYILCALAVAAVVVGLGVSARADTITIVTPTAFTCSNAYSGNPITNLLNEKQPGPSNPDKIANTAAEGTAFSPPRTVDPANPSTWFVQDNSGMGWLSNGGTVNTEWVLCNLGTTPPTINEIYLWNYTQNSNMTRGAKTLQVMVSDSSASDGTVLLNLDGSDTAHTLAQGTAPPDLCQPFPLPSTTTQYIKIKILSDWAGHTNSAGYVGIGWVRFANIGPASPEPGTLALLAAGLIGLLCYAWRKRK
jgi:hypothetical protein